MTTLTVYVGRDNKDQLRLLQNGSVVGNNIVTRADLSFGDYCIDTATDSNIRLTTNATVVEMEIGLTTGLVAGKYEGKLTIYDASNTHGIAWTDIEIDVLSWVVC